MKSPRFCLGLERLNLGQATIEYVLMLLVSLMTFILVVRGVLGPSFEKFQSDMTNRIQGVFFPGGRAGEAMHQLRISR